MITPIDQKSTSLPYPCPDTISGATQPGVPRKDPIIDKEPDVEEDDDLA